MTKGNWREEIQSLPATYGAPCAEQVNLASPIVSARYAMKIKPKNSFAAKSIPGFGMIVLLSLVASYCGTVTFLDWWSSLHGRFDSELEVHLFLIGSTHLLIRHPEVMFFCLTVLGLAVWRFAKRGQWHDLGVLLPTISFALIVVSAVYANHVQKTRPDNHAEAMQIAIKAGDQKRLREIVFACELNCGFERDSGPLVWLVDHTDSQAVGRADINAIGRMLTKKAARNESSAWLDDRRTPLEVAVDRYDRDQILIWYLLGVRNHDYHFEVPPAPKEDWNATLIYAVRQRAPLALISELLEKGANPKAVVEKTTAVETASRFGYLDALEEMRNRHQISGTKAESD